MGYLMDSSSFAVLDPTGKILRSVKNNGREWWMVHII
jgi:hypothetical protein